MDIKAPKKMIKIEFEISESEASELTTDANKIISEALHFDLSEPMGKLLEVLRMLD